MQVGKAVKAALIGRGWTVTGQQDGSVSASLSRDEWVAKIRVDYSVEKVQIRYVDSTPLAILKCETIGKKTDSTFLRPDEFNRLAAEFLPPEINADNLEKNFTENSFGDKTTGYLSFTYSPRDKSQPLRRVDVVVSPGEGLDKVKSIYLEKVDKQSDTLMVRKMYWQAGHSFLVITSLQPSGRSPEVRQLKVVWNNEETD